ncbi:MAG: hypothetical protein AB9869_37095 [Verrucomicrobiia bacterium]
MTRLDELEQRFLAAARALPLSSEVPYAFEKRIMAALAAQAPADPWSQWAQWLWRAAAPCVAVMLAVTAWTLVASELGRSDAGLAAELERAVWAPLNAIDDTW